MVRVKICGMMTPEDVAMCARSGADALGFIFARGPRRLEVDLAARLTSLVPPFVTTVGVFAADDAALVRETLARCRLDLLQFSGGESPAFMGSFGRPTIVVVRAADDGAGADPPSRDGGRDPVPDRASLEQARAVALMADAGGGAARGGTGLRVDERIASKMRRRSALPFILAGGLTPDNVLGAIATVRPWAVDVRSGVERDGAKDRVLVERFVRAAHGAAIGSQIENDAFALSAQPLGGI